MRTDLNLLKIVFLVSALFMACAASAKPPTVLTTNTENRTLTEPQNADDQFQLGLAHLQGNGVPFNNVEAAKWFQRAAERGHVAAQFRLGACYYYGWGVPEDTAQAAKWYRKAAEKGNVEAMLQLALCYMTGKGVPEDKAEAFKWFQKAAAQGDEIAQCHLGRCYEFGEGIARDRIAAWMWYEIADSSGTTDLEDGRPNLAKQMSSADIAKARSLSKVWQAEHSPKRPREGGQDGDGSPQ